MTNRYNIPAEHYTRLLTMDDNQLAKLREHNRAEAARQRARGTYGYDDYRRVQAYVDTIDDILTERAGGIRLSDQPAPTGPGCYYCGTPGCDDCGPAPAALAGFGQRHSR